MKLRTGLSLAILGAALAQSCGSKDDKKRVAPLEDAGLDAAADAIGPAEGGPGGAGGEGGTGGTGGAGGTDAAPGGTGGVDAAVDGSAVTDASRDASTGSGGADASADAAVDARADAGPADAARDALMDAGPCGDALEQCCAGSTCSAGLTCAGSGCTCVKTISGNMATRVDGYLLEHNGSTQTPIRDSTTGDPISGVDTARRSHWHGCARKLDGTVWCWAGVSSGSNNNGELGDGTTTSPTVINSATQVQIDPGDAGGPMYLTGVSALQVDSFSGYLSGPTCAVKADHTLWCWGDDRGGANLMQTGADAPYATPIQSSAGVPITDAAGVAVGNRHACYLTTGGAVLCWGLDVQGTLGQGTDGANLTYPSQAVGLDSGVSKVVAGPDSTCVLFDSGPDAGRVRCWGATIAGNIGIGPPDQNTDGCINYCKTTPTRVRTSATALLENVIDIYGGYQTTCALLSDRSVWCWGALTGSNVAVPLQISGTPVTNVSTASLHGDILYYVGEDGSYHRVTSTSNDVTIDANCGALF